MRHFKLISTWPKHGQEYGKPAELEFEFDDSMSDANCLETIYWRQGNNPLGCKEDSDQASASVGDLITTTVDEGDHTMMPKTWAVAPAGFVQVHANTVHAWFKAEPGDRPWIIRDLTRR